MRKLLLALPIAAIGILGMTAASHAQQTHSDQNPSFKAPGGDVIDAGPGDDEVKGGEGNDVIQGGPGNDQIEGGPGADQIQGGPGDDEIQGDSPHWSGGPNR